MRLISRKIWRAFPELDQYEEEVCIAYVKHARRLGNIWKGAICTLAAFFIGFGIWLGVVYLTPDLFEIATSPLASDVQILLSHLLISVMVTGFIWFSLLCEFITRDVWLRRTIRAHLNSITCDGCGYQLVGLTIESAGHMKFVVCPECGNRTELNRGHITEADINPELLATD